MLRCSRTNGMTRSILSLISLTCSMTERWAAGCCSQAPFATSRRPRGCRPKSSSNGVKPVEAWGTSRMPEEDVGDHEVPVTLVFSRHPSQHLLQSLVETSNQARPLGGGRPWSSTASPSAADRGQPLAGT